MLVYLDECLRIAARPPNSKSFTNMALIDAVLVARWPLIGVVILLYALRLFRQYYRLRAFKGPWGSGFSSLWMLYAVRTKRMHLEYARINEKYGKHIPLGDIAGYYYRKICFLNPERHLECTVSAS